MLKEAIRALTHVQTISTVTKHDRSEPGSSVALVIIIIIINNNSNSYNVYDTVVIVRVSNDE